MMSGHDLNPIFCKKKSCTSKTLDNPPPPTSDNISFLPYTSNAPQSGRHICITPYLCSNKSKLSAQ